jgi:hypothetical protein
MLRGDTTIVIAEEQFASPFDVNHIVIRKCRHDALLAVGPPNLSATQQLAKLRHYLADSPLKLLSA